MKETPFCFEFFCLFFFCFWEREKNRKKKPENVIYNNIYKIFQNKNVVNNRK